MPEVSGYKWLEIVPGERGGRPVVKGTRVSVDDILEALSLGWSIEEVAENYRITEEAVREAIKYALEKLKRLEAVAVLSILADENIPWPLVKTLRDV